MKQLATWKIDKVWRRIRVRRKYKDQFFQRVFSDKKDLLDLYNAVNHTEYKNPDELEITTLEDVIYLSMKNDISFIISSTLNLYEHQSTFNPNIPVRGLFYFAKLYEAYITKQDADVYGRKLIKLPTPQFLVFYNGKEEMPDVLELKLSDAFEIPIEGEEAVLECKAKMLNINYGHNRNILKACKRLNDYAYFVAQVNQNLLKGFMLEDAIDIAIDTCIKQGALVDILQKCRSEVFNMILTEYNEKKHLKNTREEGREEGREETLVRLNQLNIKLIEANRIDDLAKAAKDRSYQEQLLKEFGL